MIELDTFRLRGTRSCQHSKCDLFRVTFSIGDYVNAVIGRFEY